MTDRAPAVAVSGVPVREVEIPEGVPALGEVVDVLWHMAEVLYSAAVAAPRLGFLEGLRGPEPGNWVLAVLVHPKTPGHYRVGKLEACWTDVAKRRAVYLIRKLDGALFAWSNVEMIKLPGGLTDD